jgi:hypothetical protein
MLKFIIAPFRRLLRRYYLTIRARDNPIRIPAPQSLALLLTAESIANREYTISEASTLQGLGERDSPTGFTDIYIH